MSVHKKISLERVDLMIRQGYTEVVVNSAGTIISRHRVDGQAADSAARAGCSQGVRKLNELREELIPPPTEGETKT